MLKESDKKLVPSNCEVEAVQPTVEREYTLGGRIRKIILYSLVVLFIFSLGFVLSWLRHMASHQMDDCHQFVYVFDTEQKLEDFYARAERLFVDGAGVPPESPEAREFMALVKQSRRPLVEIGPFVVFFVDDGRRRFAVRTVQPFLQPLLELENCEQFKQLRLFSLVEEGWKLPRFQAHLFYSEDGIYKGSKFTVYGEDFTPMRDYFDIDGTGAFDVMHVFEDGVWVTYHLNDLTWERVDTDEAIDRLLEEE